MSSIKKSTRRPFSWSIARKLTISASARAAAGAGGAGLAGSACGFDGGGFWRAGSSRLEVFRPEDVLAGIREAIARGAIGFDAVKHLVLCRIERRPPRLDPSVSPPP